MKKTLLATTILATLVSATAGAATVYDADGTKFSIGGRAEARGKMGEEVAGTMEDATRARLNFSGETQISDSLTGFGFAEYQINDADTDDGTAITNRYIYVGLGTQYGDFSYGKQVTANVQITGFSDIAEYHSGINQLIDAAADHQDTFLYSGTFADALTLQANYQAVSEDDSDAYGLSAVYAFDFGLDLGASFAAQDAGTSSEEEQQATFAAAYTVDSLYVAASYATGEQSGEKDFDSLEIAVKYQFSDQFYLLGMYGNTEVDDADTVDQFALEANYRFNSSLNTYVSYKLSELDSDGDEVVIGAKYKF